MKKGSPTMSTWDQSGLRCARALELLNCSSELTSYDLILKAGSHPILEYLLARRVDPPKCDCVCDHLARLFQPHDPLKTEERERKQPSQPVHTLELDEENHQGKQGKRH